MQDTSIEAFMKLKNVAESQRQVLDVLKFLTNATNAELAAKLGWPINRVTPRVKELREKGLVLDAGKRICQITRGTAHAWKSKYQAMPEAIKQVEPKPQTLFT